MQSNKMRWAFVSITETDLNITINAEYRGGVPQMQKRRHPMEEKEEEEEEPNALSRLCFPHRHLLLKLAVTGADA